MMSIKINSLALQNFKGVTDSTISFDGSSTNIFGDNATGKTTHYDAFLFCLFGKDSQGKADFDIKALDSGGTPTHNLEHSVEVVLEIDGNPLPLQRIYAERWTKKRGQATTEFTGHTTRYLINQVPAKKKEFEDRIKEVIDESAFRLLTGVKYFNEGLTWQKRRELLLEVCGNVTDQAVIESDEALATLPDILDNRTIEDHKKMILSKRKGINDELAKIPTRIDEVKKSIVEITDFTIGNVAAKISDLEAEKTKLETELADLQNGGEVSKLRVELQEVIAKITEAENAFNKGQRDRANIEQGKVDTLRKNHNTKSNEISTFDTETGKLQSEKLTLEKQVESLRAEWGEVDAKKFEHGGKCPTCGQDTPFDQIEEIEASFNQTKAAALKAITENGKTKAARISELETILTKREFTRKNLASARDKILEDIKVIEAILSSIRKEKADTEKLNLQAADIENKIADINNGSRGAIEDLRVKLTTQAGEISEQNKIILQFESNDKSEDRIVELTTQEKKLAAEFGRLENELYLIEQFTRAKVELLEDKINGKFNVARFKLFTDQINGGLTETCETVLDGVPYGSINSAGRVQVGLDIIQTLQAHYGVSAPVWIDNRESVIELPEIDTQVISLIVNEDDKVLRVEKAESINREAA
ncbi:MAG: hypothetical protein JEZ12_28650 [Desulfobacterium sp.]|nr:hypothetical protein [Desulfobacterium sp.]